MQSQKDELAWLGELLGDDHDLFLLQQSARLTCADQKEVKELNHLIEARQKKLRAAALKLGSRLYAEPPAVVCRRLESYWKDWRDKTEMNS